MPDPPPTPIRLDAWFHVEAHSRQLGRLAVDDGAVAHFLECEKVRNGAMIDPRLLLLVHLVQHPPRRIVLLLQHVEPYATPVALHRQLRVGENRVPEFANELRLHLQLDEHDEHIRRTILRTCLKRSDSSGSVSWAGPWRRT